jgi:hypothetical protein
MLCCGASGNTLSALRILPSHPRRRNAVQHRFKENLAPETLNLFGLIAFMALFGAAIFYAGASLQIP